MQSVGQPTPGWWAWMLENKECPFVFSNSSHVTCLLHKEELLKIQADFFEALKNVFILHKSV
jgi:hypothetical protein